MFHNFWNHLQSSETSPFELTPDILTSRGTKVEENVEILENSAPVVEKAADSTLPGESSEIPPGGNPALVTNENLMASLSDAIFDEPKSKIEPENEAANQRALEVFQKLFNQPPPDLAKLPPPEAPLNTDVFEVENFMPKGVSLSGL